LFIVISFNTGFYKKGALVSNNRQIIVHYLKTWFFLDLLASFPYSYFISNDAVSTAILIF